MPLSKEDFRLQAVDRIERSKGHCGEFHKMARDDFAFIAGDQWTDEDKAVLEDQDRPIVVFNYSEKMVDAVSGAEVNNRQEVVYKARTMGMDQFAEMMTHAAKWVRDECLAEDEETDAFRDALICGMGWIETKMDYSENKDGMPIQSRIDPCEMVWDTASLKPGCADRRWDAQGVWMDNNLLPLRFPDAFDSPPEGTSGDSSTEGALRHIQQGNRYRQDDNASDQDDDRRVDQTLVWSYQCCENETYYRVDNGSGGIEELDEVTFKKIRKALDQHGLKYVRSWKKVYYHGFIADGDGGEVLSFAQSPIQTGFTRQCITGKRDRNKNFWYGLTRVMKDPQRWANKWLSQIMHIINSNAKGGLLAEIGAFVDPTKAQEEWSSPDKVILLKEGGINKIKEKTMTTYPAGLSQLMEFALNALPQVTGINLEALGLADRDQANVLEQSRKQAAYGLLAPVFDSLKRYRKNQGRVLYTFIQQFISDGRLVRIVGPGYEQVVPLVKQPETFCYDVVVDQSPTAPDTKTQTWQALMQLVPAALKAGMPVPPEILSYAPIPTQLATQWQQYMKQMQSQQVPPQIQQQMEDMQKQMQQLQQENMKLKQDNTSKIIDAQTKQAQAELDMEIKRQMADQEMQLKEFETKSRLAIHGVEVKGKLDIQAQDAQNNARLQERQTEAQLENAKKTTEGGLRIKAAQSGVKAGKDGEVKMKMDNSEVVEALAKVTDTFSSALDKIVANMNRPKKVVRDKKTGALIGVE